MQLPDLPIKEVTNYLEGFLQQLGEDCTVDGTPTKIMISDLERAYDYLEENMKQAVISKSIGVTRGAKIDFASGDVAIVYTIPNDDIVSNSAKILMCNSKLEVFEYSEIYDENPQSPTYGDIISSGEVTKSYIDGFVEKVSSNQKETDVGYITETKLRFYTFSNSDIDDDDIVKVKGKKYRVVDVDDITEGLLVVQLVSAKK